MDTAHEAVSSEKNSESNIGIKPTAIHILVGCSATELQETHGE